MGSGPMILGSNPSTPDAKNNPYLSGYFLYLAGTLEYFHLFFSLDLKIILVGFNGGKIDNETEIGLSFG
jgi:hypothetical protein